MNNADLIITNGWVLTLDAEAREYPSGFVALAADRIVAVGPSADATAWRAAQQIDARGGLVMPGLVNAHTHAAMTCFRGLADDLPLMTWLNDHIFPSEARFIRPDTVHWGTLAISFDEDFPRVLVRRQVKNDGGRYFGPDAVAGQQRDGREALDRVAVDQDAAHRGVVASRQADRRRRDAVGRQREDHRLRTHVAERDRLTEPASVPAGAGAVGAERLLVEAALTHARAGRTQDAQRILDEESLIDTQPLNAAAIHGASFSSRSPGRKPTS